MKAKLSQETAAANATDKDSRPLLMNQMAIFAGRVEQDYRDITQLRDKFLGTIRSTNQLRQTVFEMRRGIAEKRKERQASLNKDILEIRREVAEMREERSFVQVSLKETLARLCSENEQMRRERITLKGSLAEMESLFNTLEPFRPELYVPYQRPSMGEGSILTVSF